MKEIKMKKITVIKANKNENGRKSWRERINKDWRKNYIEKSAVLQKRKPTLSW
jgi:hypothetical protein